ncbi:MAG: hypothetical protein Tsb005_01050 [Gammaproteobacteria bacterium]
MVKRVNDNSLREDSFIAEGAPTALSTLTEEALDASLQDALEVVNVLSLDMKKQQSALALYDDTSLLKRVSALSPVKSSSLETWQHSNSKPSLSASTSVTENTSHDLCNRLRAEASAEILEQIEVVDAERYQKQQFYGALQTVFQDLERYQHTHRIEDKPLPSLPTFPGEQALEQSYQQELRQLQTILAGANPVRSKRENKHELMLSLMSTLQLLYQGKKKAIYAHYYANRKTLEEKVEAAKASAQHQPYETTELATVQAELVSALDIFKAQSKETDEQLAYLFCHYQAKGLRIAKLVSGQTTENIHEAKIALPLIDQFFQVHRSLFGVEWFERELIEFPYFNKRQRLTLAYETKQKALDAIFFQEEIKLLYSDPYDNTYDASYWLAKITELEHALHTFEREAEMLNRQVAQAYRENQEAKLKALGKYDAQVHSDLASIPLGPVEEGFEERKASALETLYRKLELLKSLDDIRYSSTLTPRLETSRWSKQAELKESPKTNRIIFPPPADPFKFAQTIQVWANFEKRGDTYQQVWLPPGANKRTIERFKRSLKCLLNGGFLEQQRYDLVSFSKPQSNGAEPMEVEPVQFSRQTISRIPWWWGLLGQEQLRSRLDQNNAGNPLFGALYEVLEQRMAQLSSGYYRVLYDFIYGSHPEEKDRYSSYGYSYEQKQEVDASKAEQNLATLLQALNTLLCIQQARQAAGAYLTSQQRETAVPSTWRGRLQARLSVWRDRFIRVVNAKARAVWVEQAATYMMESALLERRHGLMLLAQGIVPAAEAVLQEARVAHDKHLTMQTQAAKASNEPAEVQANAATSSAVSVSQGPTLFSSRTETPEEKADEYSASHLPVYS